MRKFLYYLTLAILTGGFVFVLACYPEGSKRLAIDAGRDALELGQGIASIRENGENHWDRATVPLRKLAHDAKSNLLTIDAPAAAPAPAVSTAAQSPPDQPAPPPTPPAWKAPSVLPAKDDWTWVTVSGATYSHVKVVGMTPSSVTIVYTGGGGQVLVSDLPADLQKELGYDPSATDSPAPGTSTPAGATDSIEKEYQSTLATARANRKNVLLFFTGSTWCPTCICFERDVVPTAKYRYFLEANYVVMKVELTHEGLTTDPNQVLAARNNVQGVPTLVALTPDGVEIGRFMGCPAEFTQPGPGVDAFTDQLIASLTNTQPPAPQRSLEQPPKL